MKADVDVLMIEHVDQKVEDVLDRERNEERHERASIPRQRPPRLRSATSRTGPKLRKNGMGRGMAASRVHPIVTSGVPPYRLKSTYTERRPPQRRRHRHAPRSRRPGRSLSTGATRSRAAALIHQYAANITAANGLTNIDTPSNTPTTEKRSGQSNGHGPASTTSNAENPSRDLQAGAAAGRAAAGAGRRPSSPDRSSPYRVDVQRAEIVERVPAATSTTGARCLRSWNRTGRRCTQAPPAHGRSTK